MYKYILQGVEFMKDDTVRTSSGTFSKPILVSFICGYQNLRKSII